MELQPDSILLERLPDDDAIQALYQRYGRMVYSVAFSVLNDSDLADDATQSVFLVLIGKAHELKGRRSVAGWLYVASTRTARAIKRNEVARRVRERAYAGQDTSTGARHHVDIAAELDRLRPIEREALLLRFVGECTFDEIGSQLNLSPNACRMRVERTLAKLRDRLRGADASVWLVTAFALQPTSQTVRKAPNIKELTSNPVGPFRGGTRMLSVKLLAIGLMAPLGIGGYVAFRESQTPLGQARSGDQTAAPPSAVEASGQPKWSDLAFTWQPFRNGKPWASQAWAELASFSTPSTADLTVDGKRLELVLIPRGKPDDYSCDIKETLTSDPNGDNWSTIREKMDAPTLGSYRWQPGQTVFISVTPGRTDAFHVYNSDKDIPDPDKAYYYSVRFTAKPGVQEDPKFWQTHIVSGHYDDEIVEARPVSVTLDVRYTQDGKEVAHRTLSASNDKPGDFVVRRADGIRSEITVLPHFVGASPFVTWHWLEFREIPKPQDPLSGHGSLGGAGSAFQPVRNESYDLSLDDHYDAPTHLACQVRVLRIDSGGRP